MRRAEQLAESIGRARDYTNHLLTATPTSDWFRMPQEAVSHIAWQVGHLAFAQYRLALERVRGERPGDEALISPAFIEKFGRTSAPVGDPQTYPPAEEIRRVFDGIHRQALDEIAALDDSVLDQPVSTPHSRFTTKGGSIAWCAEHEVLHAGQIGLLRRLVGHDPLW
jgi:hypothetical protein